MGVTTPEPLPETAARRGVTAAKEPYTGSNLGGTTAFRPMDGGLFVYHREGG